jgi:transcriptional regulator with XRE-family HTH domain
MIKHDTVDFFVLVGEKIATQRKGAELTQAELAAKLHIKQQALALYESGLRRIPLPTLLKLSELLELSIEDFLPIAHTIRKRGPVPKIQKQLERVQQMPTDKQNLILGLIDKLSESE